MNPDTVIAPSATRAETSPPDDRSRWRGPNSMREAGNARQAQVSEMNGTLEAVAALAPAIAARSEEIERGRRLPPDLVEELTAAGCFRMLVPRSHGGAEARPAGADAGDRGAGAGRRLGRVDGDDRRRGTGAAREAAAGHVRRHVRRRPRRHRRRHVQPDRRGHAGRRRVPGHRTVVVRQRLPALPLVRRPLHRGRRPPAADAHDGAAPRPTSRSRTPGRCRACAAPAATTSSSTTSSCRPSAASCCGTSRASTSPLLRIPELSLSSLRIGAVAVGIAHGALGEVTDLATGKVPLFSDGTLASNPLFQNQLGDADARLRAARTLLYADAETAWATAVAGTPFTPEHRARIRATATWVTRTAASVVDMAYTAGGGSSIYSSKPAPAPPARHPRPDPTLRGQARHVHQGRRRARRSRRRPHVPVTCAPRL